MAKLDSIPYVIREVIVVIVHLTFWAYHNLLFTLVVMIVDAPFCPDYLFSFQFLLDFGPVFDKVRVWASNLFRYMFYLFYQIF